MTPIQETRCSESLVDATGNPCTQYYWVTLSHHPMPLRLRGLLMCSHSQLSRAYSSAPETSRRWCTRVSADFAVFFCSSR